MRFPRHTPTAVVQRHLQADIDRARAAGKPLRQAERRVARLQLKEIARKAKSDTIARRREKPSDIKSVRIG